MHARRNWFTVTKMGLFRSIAVAAALFGAASATPYVPRLKPPAPESPYILRDEALRLRMVFESLDERQYDAAQAFADDLGDPLNKDIARWAILRSNTPDQELRAYDAFLDNHPGWPGLTVMQRKAEALMDEETPPGELLAFYDTRDPLGGFAKLYLGKALLEMGRDDLGAEYIRSAWIEHNFNREDSRAIVKAHGNILREEDHFAKADRALFRRTTAGTEDVDGLLSRRRAKEVEARKNLLRGRTAGRTLFNKLPKESQRDPGVLHAMVRYLRRQKREDEAIRISAFAPTDAGLLRNPESWYYERKLLARWALKNGRFEDAYTLTAYSGVTDGSSFAEAEFFAGWLALRFLNDPEKARAHFDFLTSKVSSPISLARGNYWLARTAEVTGDRERARAHYMVAADYPYTYYGQLAIETLGNGAPVFSFPEVAKATEKDKEDLAKRDLIRALHILDHIDQDITFRLFAMRVDDQLTEAEEVRAYADLVRRAGHFDLVVRGGKATRKAGAAVPEIIYPLYPVPEAATAFTEAPLILGLSRQESEFRVDAYSSARAKGMMQLIDSTAKITARKEGLPYYPSRLLTDPEYNMTLGAAHLSHLLERFNGSYVMVLAGYNAGPHRVDKWIEEYGDPRTDDVDPVDWVELIPFNETRNYVMRVLENTQVYRARISNVPLGLQLADDLTRGGTATPAAIGKPVPLPVLWQNAEAVDGPLIDTESIDAPPLAIMRAEQRAENEAFRTLLSPNDPQESASSTSP
ncbi:MAG: lytic transglycosylase domain-containing protein [Pseudomonadota bacterium]